MGTYIQAGAGATEGDLEAVEARGGGGRDGGRRGGRSRLGTAEGAGAARTGAGAEPAAALMIWIITSTYL